MSFTFSNDNGLVFGILDERFFLLFIIETDDLTDYVCVCGMCCVGNSSACGTSMFFLLE